MTAATGSLAPETAAVLRRLAELSRPPGSPGEREAAEILAAELSGRGARAWIEAERVHGTYWVPIGLACGVAAACGLGGRLAGLLGGTAAGLSVADDLEVGVRPLRRVLKQRVVHNVVAEIAPRAADGGAGGDGDGDVLVIHAHHDAARTGLVFHPAGAKLMTRLAGGLVERVGGTPAPMWGAVAGPGLVAAGGLLGSRRLRRMGIALSAGFTAAMVNIAFSPAVPGANDNLSSVCALLEVAAALERRPPERLRVLLVSTGSEESFLEAMVRFGERHFPRLAPERTTFLCLESVGSPELMLLSGEGLLTLQRYPQDLIDRLTELARDTGVRLRAPFRYRLATDGQVPLRAGYRTAVISSMDWYKAPSNYHWPTDRPENLDPGRIADTARLAEAFAHRLDDECGGGGSAGG